MYASIIVCPTSCMSLYCQPHLPGAFPSPEDNNATFSVFPDNTYSTC